MRISEAWEKRNWGGPKPTWRLVPPLHTKKKFKGPSVFTTRVASRKRTKKLTFGGSSITPY
jgi:hypothetical protein